MKLIFIKRSFNLYFKLLIRGEMINMVLLDIIHITNIKIWRELLMAAQVLQEPLS